MNSTHWRSEFFAHKERIQWNYSCATIRISHKQFIAKYFAVVESGIYTIDLYISGLLARRQNAWSQDGGNMRVIADGVNEYQDRPAGLLLWFVLVCRVMPRSLIFQDKLQLYKAKSSIFNSCFFILLYVYWKMEFNLFRFSTMIYLLASYGK